MGAIPMNGIIPTKKTTSNTLFGDLLAEPLLNLLTNNNPTIHNKTIQTWAMYSSSMISDGEETPHSSMITYADR